MTYRFGDSVGGREVQMNDSGFCDRESVWEGTHIGEEPLNYPGSWP